MSYLMRVQLAVQRLVLKVVTELTLRLGAARERPAAATAYPGQGFVEYTLMVAGLAIAVLVGVKFFGDAMNSAFQALAGKIAAFTQ